MNSVLNRVGAIIAVFFCSFSLAACGGGGGGGTPVPAAYSGVATQAVIDGDNAEAILLELLEGGLIGDELFVILPLAADPQTSSGGSRDLLGLAAALEAPVRQLPWGSLVEQTASAASVDGDKVQAAAVETGTIPGDCGGSANYTLSGNNNSFSGTFVFNSYCSDGVVLSGTVKLSASYNQSTEVVKLTMTFVSLTASLAGEIFTVDGSMSMTMNLNTDAVTFAYNMVLANSFSEKTAYLRYSISVTPKTTYDEVTLSGRFYAHDDGYVDLSTEVPLQVTFQPVAGVIKVSGANGSWAKLEFTGNGQYVITCSDGAIINGTLN